MAAMILFLVSCLYGVTVALHVDLTTKAYARGRDVTQATVDRLHGECIFGNDRLFLRRMAYVESRDGMDPHTYRLGYYGGIWQIEEAELNATSSCAGQLAHYCNKVRTVFGIEWTHVVWEDLTKPLYSALAARLFIELKHFDVLPARVDEQAMLWAMLFNQNKDYLKFITYTKAIPKENCDTKIDLSFVVDASGSITFPNFIIVKDFLKNATALLNVGEYNTRVAMVKFSRDANVEFDLNTHYNKTNIYAAIDNMIYDKEKTNTAAALDLTTSHVFQSSAGSRDDAVKLILLITDGESDIPSETLKAAQRAKDSGIIIFSLGIGLPNFDELNAVSTPPQCTHVSAINNFDELDSILDEVHKSACRASRWVSHGETNHYEINDKNQSTIVTAVIPPDTNNTGIVTTVECGRVEVYISYTTPHPGPSLHDALEVATPDRPSVIHIESTSNGRPVYITYIGSQMPGDISKCDTSSFNITYTDGKPTGNAVKCFDKNGTEVVCTPLDLLVSPYGHLLCKDTEETMLPPNPCTENNLLNAVFYHPYPGDTSKFIRCDYSGQMFITLCPPHQVYNEHAHTCGGVHSGPIGTDYKLPLESTITNPCTVMSVALNHYFYPHPIIQYYIQCDTWGHAWKVPCPASMVWSAGKHKCVPDSTHVTGDHVTNPCTPTAIANGHLFHTYPNNIHQFIQCSLWGHMYIQDCRDHQVWSQVAETCT